MSFNSRDQKASSFQTPIRIDRSGRSATAIARPLKNIEKRSDLRPIPEDKELEIHSELSSERLKKTNSPVERVLINPVIEHWYADPYNRHDTDGPNGVALRRKVLVTALRNRGFRGPRVASIANWLVRCNGTFQKYEDLVGSNCRKKRTEKQGRYSASQGRVGVSKSKTISHKPESSYGTAARRKKSVTCRLEKEDDAAQAQCDVAAYPSPVSMRAGADDEQHTEDETVEGTYENDADKDVDTDAESVTSSAILNEEDEAVCQQLSEEFRSAHSSHEFRTTHALGTQEHCDARDDWLLARLRRTQEFWNIIYGDDLDQQDRETMDRVKFTYFCNQSVVPTVDLQYPSQGLRPIKSVMHQGREVWTEDENFGLYVPEKKDRAK